ncbi:hypothetical protein [Streptomyces sporangiiformans]|uniref:Alpha/beta hydrolase n=1 Tax=Streptomyces sporangiiformans TaxID=2315329 RepID=A0A505DED8_9ACTN|nr:hypothetical protein [Streptomyces sporangiiformans]TPQ16169.1 hypothetical protein FGD71_043105 [Streptomyces sporangiiformans]
MSTAVPRRHGRWPRALAAGALGAAVLTAAPSADGASARTGAPARTESPVASTSPVTGVTETKVSVRIPLPASVGSRPAQCDWLSYLRYRSSGGPSKSAEADRILVAQPGILEGAGAFDSVARNTVKAAAEKGQHIEFWALDRRSNCLEDNTGIATGDATKAVDYYYRGKRVDGRKFDGFLKSDQVRWLAEVGLERTVRDQYDLLAAELPDQKLRKEKVMCGGHSLGGVLTGVFATWDFDGNKATKADAGFNQCAGYFALDTTIATNLDDLNGSSGTLNGSVLPEGTVPDTGLGFTALQAGLRSGVLPRFLALPVVLNPETMNLLAIGGLAARVAPGAESELLGTVPSNVNIETTSRTMFSKNAATFLTGKPSIRDFRLTNAAVLGTFMDDNSAPLSFIQSSVGLFDGGRIVDKNFPLSNDVQGSPALFGTELKAIPDEPDGPLYTWRNYDRVGAADDPVHRSADGTPFTTAAKEVTDIGELARSLSEQPLDFTEDYFPTKLVTDLYLVDEPQIAGHMPHTEGLKANPSVTFVAGDGILADHIPEDKNPVVLPGYQHLDVITAAPVQNDGKREQIATRLSAFARQP